MKLLLSREHETLRSTHGELFIDGAYECQTLELPKGKRIPPGIYPVSLYSSPRLNGLEVLLLHNVPGFAMVEVHPGNSPADTHGCILVGMLHSPPDFLLRSYKAFDALMPDIKAVMAKGGQVSLEVREAIGPARGQA